jgi:hypothetical protein
MADFEQLLRFHPIPIGDPIGPWLRDALQHQRLDPAQVAELTRVQIGLQKQVLALQRQMLDLHAQAFDAIEKAAGSAGQT